MRAHQERTELQDEASKKNLRKGRKPAPRLNEKDEHVISFPFGHKKPGPEEFSNMKSKDLTRWELVGSQDPAGCGRDRFEQIMVGWRLEQVAKRRELLRTKVFKRKRTVKARTLLRILMPVVDGFPKRLRRVQEMTANMGILVAIFANHDALFPSDRSYLHEVVRISKGREFRSGCDFGRLADPDALIDLETAAHVSPLILVYSRFFCSKSAAGYLNAKKGAAARGTVPG